MGLEVAPERATARHEHRLAVPPVHGAIPERGKPLVCCFHPLPTLTCAGQPSARCYYSAVRQVSTMCHFSMPAFPVPLQSHVSWDVVHAAHTSGSTAKRVSDFFCLFMWERSGGVRVCHARLLPAALSSAWGASLALCGRRSCSLQLLRPAGAAGVRSRRASCRSSSWSRVAVLASERPL